MPKKQLTELDLAVLKAIEIACFTSENMVIDGSGIPSDRSWDAVAYMPLLRKQLMAHDFVEATETCCKMASILRSNYAMVLDELTEQINECLSLDA